MTDFQPLADDQVKALRSALRGSSRDFMLVGSLIRGILLHELWKKRYVEQEQREREFTHFLDFVTMPPPAGLGTTIQALKKFCRAGGDLEAVLAIDKAVRRKRGRPENNSLHCNELFSSRGNTAGYALQRLADREELQAAVLDGRMSANAAMIEAGLRGKTHTIPHDVTRAAAAIRRHFTPAEVAEIARLLHWEKR